MSENEQIGEEAFRGLQKLNPYSIVEQAIHNNPNIGADREKLYVPASFISDTLNLLIKKESDYDNNQHILYKNLERLLISFNTSLSQFLDLRRRIMLSTREVVEETLDREAGFYRLRGSGPWLQHFGWFNPQQMKLHLLKGIVNNSAVLIPHLLNGDRVEEAKQPISLFINRVTERMSKALGFEQNEGLLPTSRDRNLENVMNTIHRGLVFICEEDNYYRTWLAYLCIAIWEEMHVLFDGFDMEMFNSDVGAKVKFSKDGLPVEMEELFKDPLAKKRLFYWFLSKHLNYVDKSDLTIRRKKIG